MCGFYGEVGRLNTTERHLVDNKIHQALYHRGPDSGNSLIDKSFHLLHRRLKIIDLSDDANQPMLNDDGSHIIIYNGEIYNFLTIREDLEKLGHKFKTNCDTEVLLRAYAEYGNNCVTHFNGIFAFVILDKTQNLLFGARDHIGVKPFYFYRNGTDFRFSSEIKGLFESGVEAKVNSDCIYEQLMYGFVSGEETIFQNVKRLEPGHQFVFDLNNSKFSSKPYCNFTEIKPEFNPSTLKDASQQLETELQKAVKLQMISDVPLGFMCSGGIDSSLLSAVAQEKAEKSINTYCARIPEKNFDESQYAKLVSDHIGSNHYEITSEAEDIMKLIPTLIWLHDEPLRHPNSVPIFQISKKAKKRETVLLSGEGADELFGGYNSYTVLKNYAGKRLKWGSIPYKLASAVYKFKGKTSVSLEALSQKSKGDILMGFDAQSNNSLLKQLLGKSDLVAPNRQSIANKSIEAAGNDLFRALMKYDQNIHLQSLLYRQDKMSMGCSIESRVPILDKNIIELSHTFNSVFLNDGSTEKIVLRKVARKYLPEEIFTRPKYPFALPFLSWIRQSESLRDALNDISKGYLATHGFINSEIYNGILKQLKKGDESVVYLVWNIFNLEIACKLFITKELAPNTGLLPAYE